MKQKDIVLFIAVGVVSAVFAYVLSSVIVSPGTKDATAEVVDEITTEFLPPDSRYFNEQSINPTQLIEIKDQSNNQLTE